MLKGIFCAVLTIALLSACSLSLSTEELLNPPRLTSQQAAIYDALESAIGTSSFKFKYPRRGDYLSACILQDLNGDSVDEAIAFYELTVAGSTSTWMSLLTQNEEGWRSVKEIPGSGADIDLVAFAPITGKEQQNIIVGWSAAGLDGNSCVIYSYGDSKLEPAHEVEFFYHELLVSNMDDNTLSELLLCTKSGTHPPTMRLVKFRSGRVVTTSEVRLPTGTKGFSQLLFGPLTSSMSAVFADIVLDSNRVTTVIAPIDRSMISEFSPQDLGVFHSFERPVGASNCVDINRDGLIDIPVNYALPGYSSADLGENERLDRTEYLTIGSGKVEVAGNAIINAQAGYRLLIPQSWVNTVTVRKQPDTGEWRFCIYAGDLAASTTELLRLKVVAPGDYQDKLETAQYRTIATKGINEYKAHIPTNDFPGYSLSDEQLTTLFSLL